MRETLIGHSPICEIVHQNGAGASVVICPADGFFLKASGILPRSHADRDVHVSRRDEATKREPTP